MTNAQPAPGWYPDSERPGGLRWWDGSQWTEHRNAPPAPAVATPAAAPLHAAPMHVAPAYTAPMHAAAMHAVPSHVGPVVMSASASSASTSGKAIASLITGVFGLSPVAIILGVIAHKDINRAPAHAPLKGGGLATGGIVIGALWVLMIPLLMAIAIPTFLAQKEAAEKQAAGSTAVAAGDGRSADQAKALVKLAVTAVESCAVSNLDGSYTGCGADGVKKLEPASVASLNAGCEVNGGVCIELEGPQGFQVRSSVAAGDTRVMFVERHVADGTIQRTCSPQAAGVCDTGDW